MKDWISDDTVLIVLFGGVVLQYISINVKTPSKRCHKKKQKNTRRFTESHDLTRRILFSLIVRTMVRSPCEQRKRRPKNPTFSGGCGVAANARTYKSRTAHSASQSLSSSVRSARSARPAYCRRRASSNWPPRARWATSPGSPT